MKGPNRMTPRQLTETEESQSFEHQLEMIEAIVADLESGSLSLDDMLNRYEAGMRLIAACQQRLNDAELKVTEIAEVTASTSMKAHDRGTGNDA